MRSASRTVLIRCETRIVVRSWKKARMRSSISRSVAASTLESASSRTTTRGAVARERHPLLLPAGERDAALADDGVEPRGHVRQVAREAGHVDGGRDPFFAPPVLALVHAEGDVVADGTREEERVLRHDPDLAAEP